MFCHEARSASLAMCHVLSCSAYAWGIFRSRFRHIAVHSLTASPACPRPSRAGSPGGGAAFMSCAQTSARAAAGTSLAASFAAGAGRGIGCSHACLLSGKGRDGMSLFRARFARAGGRVSAPARFARLIARARRRTHLSRLLTPGAFSAPSRSLSAETPKGGPGSRLSTFILHHTAKCQARTGTKNENTVDFSWNAGDGNRSGAVSDCPTFQAGAAVGGVRRGVAGTDA